MVIIIDTALKQGGIVEWDGGIKAVHSISALSLPDLSKLLVHPIVAESVQLFGLGKIALANKYEAKGILLGIAATNNVPIEWVHAKTWQKHFGFKKDTSDYQWKKYLWEQANEYYPCTKEQADAILITRYYEEVLHPQRNSKPK